jgi:hypothetical protein
MARWRSCPVPGLALRWGRLPPHSNSARPTSPAQTMQDHSDDQNAVLWAAQLVRGEQPHLRLPNRSIGKIERGQAGLNLRDRWPEERRKAITAAKALGSRSGGAVSPRTQTVLAQQVPRRPCKTAAMTRTPCGGLRNSCGVSNPTFACPIARSARQNSR